jgi:hypothetical protein
MMARKSYKELSKLTTFEERFKYLKLTDKKVGEDTFGGRRYLNQQFYRSNEWKKVRDQVILRDQGRDLGVEGEEFGEGEEILIHHLNPITEEDLINMNPCVFDLDNLISTRKRTHNGIHYGDMNTLNRYVERKPGDTRLW